MTIEDFADRIRAAGYDAPVDDGAIETRIDGVKLSVVQVILGKDTYDFYADYPDGSQSRSQNFSGEIILEKVEEVLNGKRSSKP